MNPLLIHRIRVKVCGITRPEDGLAAAMLGVDAIGLVFYRSSPRFVDALTAKRIMEILPPFVTTVGLFVNAAVAEVHDIMRQVPLDLLQFHGDEAPDYCVAFGRPFIKAVPMNIESDVADYARRFKMAAGLLLDSHGGGKTGGSGQRFDWTAIPAGVDKPIILAGGLNSDNVAEAIHQVQPFGVDVSSGVESAKGVKDHELMRLFMRRIDHDV